MCIEIPSQLMTKHETSMTCRCEAEYPFSTLLIEHETSILFNSTRGPRVYSRSCCFGEVKTLKTVTFT